MKFLVTGSIRQKKGPALLVSAVSLYIISSSIFTLISGYHKDITIHFANLSSPLVIIEEAHTELFFAGLLFLFTASVFRELYSKKIRKVTLIVLFLLGILYPLIYIVAFYYPPLISVYSLVIFTYYIFIITLNITIIIKLNSGNIDATNTSHT